MSDGCAAAIAKGNVRGSAGLSALLVGLVAASLAAIGAGERGQTSAPVAAERMDEPCALAVVRVAAPIEPVLGAVLSISTSLRTTCGPDPRPLHLVLLVDASDSMVGEPLRALQDGIERALYDFDMVVGERPQLAVVAFADEAEVKRALTSSVDQVIAGVRGIVAGGGSCLDCGLDEALKVLRAGRVGHDPEDLREVVLLLSQGVVDECERVRAKANEVKAHGVVLVAGCQGRACDRGCLYETATIRRYVFSMSTWTELRFRMRELIAADGAFHPIDRIILVDDLAEELAYLEGGETTSVDGNRLLWIFEPWTTDALTRTYRAGVAACGRFPLGKADQIGATIEYNMAFWEGRSHEHPLPNPIIAAECHTATATPTPSSEGPTPTGTRPTEPTPRPPTATPTATDRADPEPRAWHAHFPLALAGACAPPTPPLDLVIAVDVSHSMYLTPIDGVDGDGGAWRAAAHFAAATVAGLRPAVDRVGVLAYGDDTGAEAFVVRRLERCCAPGLVPPPDAFWKLDGSRIDRAIIRAVAMHEEAPISPGAERAVVVVTDGDLNQTGLPQFEAALGAARRAGIAIDTVLMGRGEAEVLRAAVARAGERLVRLVRIEPGRSGWYAVRDLCR